jgi:hypothetical protein
LLDKLKAKKAEIERLREERGATDPILIIAGIAITLILLVGGSFAISGFIANANDLNAKGDLDRVATAQAAYLAERDSYAADLNGLRSSSIGFTPTDGNRFELLTSPDGWVAATKSASGSVFIRTSESSSIAEASNGSYTGWTLERTNLSTNPIGTGPVSDAGYVPSNSAVISTAPDGVRVARTNNAGNGTAVVEMSGALDYAGPGAYSISADVTNTSTVTSAYNFYVSGDWVPAGRNGTNIALAPGETARVSMDVTLSGSVKGNMHLRRTSNTSATEMVMSNVLFERENTSYQFFDGGTASSGVLRHSWAGPENASASRLETRTMTSPGSVPTISLPAGITQEQVVAAVQSLG